MSTLQLKLLTVTEAAALIGLTEGRLRQLLQSGAILGEKFGSQWAITEAEAQRYAALEPPAVGRPRLTEPKKAS